MDMLERLHSYRDFGISSGQLTTRFEAAELRLQEWANGVGIMNDRLKEPHHTRLDDPKVLLMTKKILNHIGELFPAAKRTLSKLRQSTHLERNISLNMVESSSGEGKYQKAAPTKSIRTKFSWAFGREASFT